MPPTFFYYIFCPSIHQSINRLKISGNHICISSQLFKIFFSIYWLWHKFLKYVNKNNFATFCQQRDHILLIRGFCPTFFRNLYSGSQLFSFPKIKILFWPARIIMGCPGCMFLNSSLACVTTHVLARVITHVLARALLHVLAQSSGQFELACVATHVLARVAIHVLGHVSIPITYLHCHQGHWCGQTRGRRWVSSSGISHMLVLLNQFSMQLIM